MTKKSRQIQPVIAFIAVMVSIYIFLRCHIRNHMVTEPQKNILNSTYLLVWGNRVARVVLYNLSAAKV